MYVVETKFSLTGNGKTKRNKNVDVSTERGPNLIKQKGGFYVLNIQYTFISDFRVDI